jgi:hypothetical protein
MKGWRYRQPYRLTNDDLGRDWRVIKTDERVTITMWDGDTVTIWIRTNKGSRKEQLRRSVVEARIDSGAWERA